MMKFIIAAPLLLFCCLPAVQSSNPSIVRKGQSDSSTQIEAQAVTSMKEQDDSENEDEQGHRKLYTPPLWLARIIAEFTGINLQRCYRKPSPPTNGDPCSKKAKTCYWGDQVCPDGRPYPTIECFCNGNGVTKGTWSCIDPLPCPVDSTSSPSAGPTIELSTTPTILGTMSADPSTAPTIISTAPTPEDDLGSISGNVKGDDDKDDIGDVNLANVQIELLDSGGNPVATTETDADGNYVFYDLPVGSYSVTETNIATYPLDVSDIDSGDLNNIGPVTIGGANPVNSTGNDFVDCPFRTISGVVLEDTDNNNSGDAPIPTVTVTVFDVSGAPVATIVTDSTGAFSVQVPPGVYSVVETNGNGFADVSDSDGGDPNVITADVTLDDSAGLAFVDEIP